MSMLSTSVGWVRDEEALRLPPPPNMTGIAGWIGANMFPNWYNGILSMLFLLFVAMVVTTAIYVLVALSAVAVVDAARLGASAAPLALVAGRVLGDRADTALSIVALGATANTALLFIVSASRSIYGMAAAGALPQKLAQVGRTAIPAASTGLVLALLAGLVAVGTLREVAAVTDAVVLVVSEETGRISLAASGKLETVPREHVARRLAALLNTSMPAPVEVAKAA